MRNRVLVKLATCGGLAVVLVVLLARVQSVVDERQGRSGEALLEVSGKWGASQAIVGPVLALPYRVENREKDGTTGTRDDLALLLPDRLELDGTLAPEVRRRGIFSVVVYTLQLKVSGSFPGVEPGALGLPEDRVLWSDARLSIGTSDTRGIQEQLRVTWDGSSLPARPGPAASPLGVTGLHAPIGGLKAAGEPHTFSFTLTLRGSREVTFAPLGMETRVALRSPWPHPSFGGAFLPEVRTITPSGFAASWRIAYFGRGYRQEWRGEDLSGNAFATAVAPSAFGVALFQPATHYQQATRSIKYGLLFVALTFGAFFLFETFGGSLEIHPIQYLLVGLALCLFYLLLVSLSEQIGFGRAYLAASAGTVLLVSGYSAGILSWRRGALIGALLTGLYAYLFTLLRVEDYTLLIGSLTVFALLAAVMYATRRVNWYAIGDVPPPPPPATGRAESGAR